MAYGYIDLWDDYIRLSILLEKKSIHLECVYN